MTLRYMWCHHLKTLKSSKKSLRQRMVQIVIFAISVKDYENLANNFAELRRYIEQQKQIILYYEAAVKPSEPSEQEKKDD